MEYRFAIENKIPTIAFIRDKTEELPKKFCETESEKRKKLDKFKEQVKQKLCKFYNSPSDLGAKVSRSITQLKKQYPSDGWVKGSLIKQLPSNEKILQLKEENENLKNKITELMKKIDLEFEQFASGDDNVEIEFIFTRKKIHPDTGGLRKIAKEKDYFKTTWNTLFKIVAQNIFDGQSINGARENIKNKMYDVLTTQYPKEKIYDLEIPNQVMNKLIFQLKTLKLINIDRFSQYDIKLTLTNKGESLLEKFGALAKGEFRLESGT